MSFELRPQTSNRELATIDDMSKRLNRPIRSVQRAVRALQLTPHVQDYHIRLFTSDQLEAVRRELMGTQR